MLIFLFWTEVILSNDLEPGESRPPPDSASGLDKVAQALGA